MYKLGLAIVGEVGPGGCQIVQHSQVLNTHVPNTGLLVPAGGPRAWPHAWQVLDIVSLLDPTSHNGHYVNLAKWLISYHY
jgi:hypothetical protein